MKHKLLETSVSPLTLVLHLLNLHLKLAALGAVEMLKLVSCRVDR